MKKNYFKLLIAAILLFSSSTESNAQCLVPTQVGSISVSRSGNNWTLDGAYFTSTMSKIQNPLNFGELGTVDASFEFTHFSGVMTDALLADLDVFVIGYIPDSKFDTTELSAFYNWVNAGGKMYISADHPSYDAVAERFGYPTSYPASIPNYVVSGLSSHPLFDGPFGSVSVYNGGGSYAYFTDTVGTTVLATDAYGRAVLLEKTFGMGKVIVGGDIDVFSTAYSVMSSGPSISNSNDILLGNLFTYLSDFYETQADSDCDGVRDICDVCPGGDDSVDNNNDGTPDCAQLLPFADYSDAWKCGKNKLYVTHVPPGNPSNPQTICISYNAVASHFNNHSGDMIGPYSSCSSPRLAVNGPVLEMEVFPNPASSDVNIHLHGIVGTANLIISDPLGRTVYSQEVMEGEELLNLDLTGQSFKEGIYIVSIFTESKRVTKRLVITK